MLQKFGLIISYFVSQDLIFQIIDICVALRKHTHILTVRGEDKSLEAIHLLLVQF